MFNEHLQGVDVTSMLDASLQQKINPKIGSIKKYPTSKSQILINHVTFENFKKTLQANSLYFKKYSNYPQRDEIKYERYNGLYTKYLLDDEKEAYNLRNKVISESVYVLSMYDSDTESNLHLDRYATQPQDAKRNIGLAVFYNWERLIAHLRVHAWSKSSVDHFYETPIVSLRPCDRIFCGGIQYLNDSVLSNIAFDPADAMVPFFIKKSNNETDNEYRLCVFINPGDRFDDQAEPEKPSAIYIQVGDVLDIIDKIVFVLNDNKDNNMALDVNEIKNQFLETNFVEKNINSRSFTWDKRDDGAVELIINGHNPCANVTNECQESVRKEQSPENSEPVEPVELNATSLYSSKYDSMKQRYILMNGNREYNYRCYNATLKLEMLLFGKVTITDSQYYDGLLFKEMMDHGDFDDFITCSYKHDSFKVKIRCYNKNIVKRIYGKRFYPSSVKSYTIGKQIEQITQNLEGDSEAEKNEKCASIIEFVDYLQSKFPDPNKRFKEDLDRFRDQFVRFTSIHNCMFDLWEDIDLDGKFSDLAQKNETCELIKKNLDELDSFTKISGRKFGPFDDSIKGIRLKIKDLEAEFKKVSSFRSTINSFESEILKKCEQLKASAQLSQEKCNIISVKCRAIGNEFNYIYNRVISKQHHCFFVDMISAELTTSSVPRFNIDFDRNLAKFLFLSSWNDFNMLCSDIKVQAIRRQISSIWERVASNDSALSYDDENALHNLFISLDTVLREYYLPILNQLVENMSTSIFNPEAASSDYFGTEKLAFGNGDYGRFIGNGCSLDDSFTDKLSLYLPNESHGITIFDLCFGEHLDEGNCNTISLANIENF